MITVESTYLNDLLKWEMEGWQSREKVTVKAGQNLAMGSVLGKLRVGSVPATGTAGTNTGAGTCGSVTGGVSTKVGVYTLTCVNIVSGGGVFSVKDPDGHALPDAYVGQSYVNPAINFTLADGTPDFVLGDSFTITVPAGAGTVAMLDVDGVDGTASAYGVLIYGVDTTKTTQRQVAFTSGGVAQLQPGVTVTGVTSGATAQVVEIQLSSGTWAAGTAAGVLILDNQVGTFQSESLNASIQADICAIGANTTAYNPELSAVAIVRDAQVAPEYLSWPVGITDAQKTYALSQLALNGVVTRVSV